MDNKKRSLFKILFSLSFILPISACSSKEEKDDWRENLDGKIGHYTITYDNEERDILIQVVNTRTMYFYFDEEDQDCFAAFSLDYCNGEMDTDSVLDTISFMDTDCNGYDDFTYCFYDQNEHYIEVEYDFHIDNTEEGHFEGYELTQYDSLEGEPSEVYQDVWYYSGDLNEKKFVLDQWGNFAIIDANGEYIQTGYAYEDESGCNLYNMYGECIGNLILEDDTWIAVPIEGGHEYYARQESLAKG